MIEYIQGELINKNPAYVVIRVGGVGVRLNISAFSFEKLPETGKEIMLYTYLHIREDEWNIYGFGEPEERELFLMMISVSGIGPKLAVTILSKLEAIELKKVIVSAQVEILKTVPGVGKKTAERIILELKDKIVKQEDPAAIFAVVSDPEYGARGEAIAGLIALGYSRTEADKAVPYPDRAEKKYTAEELLRVALKKLAKY